MMAPHTLLAKNSQDNLNVAKSFTQKPLNNSVRYVIYNQLVTVWV